MDRDFTKSPITEEEILSTIGRALQTASTQTVLLSQETDTAALDRLVSFLEIEDTKLRLIRYLESTEARSIDESLSRLKKEDIDHLVRGAIFPSGQMKQTFWNITYRGESIRGSHVYDANQNFPGECRIYVRRDSDGLPRAEYREDNFRYPRRAKPNVPPPASDTPASATMTWWENLVSKWKKS